MKKNLFKWNDWLIPKLFLVLILNILWFILGLNWFITELGFIKGIGYYGLVFFGGNIALAETLNN